MTDCPIPYGEICRYLGYRGGPPPDKTMERTIHRCADQIRRAAEPRAASRTCPLDRAEDGALLLGDIRVRSAALARNLLGCQRVTLFAATLGVEVDRLIARAEATRMSEAVICQAAGAALIEAYCDQVNDALRAEAKAGGWYLRPRFSPGYGDFSIIHQRDLTQALQTPTRIGLTVTDSLQLVPSKSVTAVIGLTRDPHPCHRQGCEACEKTDCAFRR